MSARITAESVRTKATAKDWLREGMDYSEAEEALQEAFNALEGIAFQLRDALIVRGEDPDGDPELDEATSVPPATLAALGELWSFTDGVQVQLNQLEREHEHIVKYLRELNMLRLDTQAMARFKTDEIQRYYSDPALRASMPCSECGAIGGCEHVAP